MGTDRQSNTFTFALLELLLRSKKTIDNVNRLCFEVMVTAIITSLSQQGQAQEFVFWTLVFGLGTSFIYGLEMCRGYQLDHSESFIAFVLNGHR